jgi:hypothetical protein
MLISSVKMLLRKAYCTIALARNRGTCLKYVFFIHWPDRGGSTQHHWRQWTRLLKDRSRRKAAFKVAVPLTGAKISYKASALNNLAVGIENFITNPAQ